MRYSLGMFNETPAPSVVSSASSAVGEGCVESVLCEDPATLRVAERIESALRLFTPAKRRSAEMYFGEYPAAGSNPRGQRGVLAKPTPGQRSISATLTAAGGADLVDAAGRLAVWAGAVTKFRDLRWVLLGWLPEGIVSPLASAITRRLLCDTAGLVAVNETTVVSVQAATEFAAAAMGLADDVGLVNEPALRQIADHAGWDASFEGLVEACGFVRICGVLSASSGRVASAKAGLVRLGYPASAAEVAAMCHRDPSGVSSGLSVCETARKTGSKRWTLTDTDHKSVVSMWGHVDDAGLFTADTLAALAADAGWVGSVERFAALRGFVRLFGYWATADTPTAAVKAALGSLQHPATVDEIVEMTGCSVDDVIWVCRSVDTIIDAGDGCWRTCTDAGFVEFAAAAEIRDEVGLVSVSRLDAVAAAGGWSSHIDQFAQICGYQRLHGHFTLKRTSRAAVRDALWALGGAARTRDIASAAKVSYDSARNALRNCPSTHFDRVSRCWVLNTPQPDTPQRSIGAGLISDEALAELAADERWDGSLEEFAASLKFVHLFGYWVTADTPTASARAALGSLQHPATVDEIAEMTGRTVDAVRWAFRSCDTIIATGDGRWRTCTDAGFADFVGVARDDVGLVDDVGLLAAATAGGWSDRIDKFAQICRYQRFNGRLASRRTPQAVVKAALWALGGAAAVRDIAQAAEMTNNETVRAVTHCSSIRFDRTSRRWMITTDDTAPQLPTSRTVDTAPRSTTSRTVDTAPQSTTSRTVDTAPQSTTSRTVDTAPQLPTSRTVDTAPLSVATRGAAPERGPIRAVAERAEAVAAVRQIKRPVTITEIAERIGRTHKAVYAIFDTEPLTVQVAPQRWNVDTFNGTLRKFAAAAAGCCDDVGLINETELRRVAQTSGWADRFDELVQACGFVRFSGVLSAKTNTPAAVKAALLTLDRPANLDDITRLSGRDRHQVAAKVGSIESLMSVSPGVWVDKTARGGIYAQFAAAVQANRDDVGLIDEHRLTETATSDGWDVPIEALIGDCGLSRVRGRLAWADTALATIKVALLELRRPATLQELCTITGLPYGVTRASVARSASMHRITKGVPHHAGLIAVA